MIDVRRAADRGHFNHGWLETYHTFSFADYKDPRYMGFRTLRVINDDIVAPGKGFAPQFHKDMEIITFMLEGSLAQKDSMGKVSKIYAGEIQYMSAGRGVEHSEYNPDASKPCHLLQIWILPGSRGLTPTYDQKKITPRIGGWTLLASGDGRRESIKIRQKADIFLGQVNASQSLDFSPERSKGQWVQVTRGELLVNGTKLTAGDGAGIEEEEELSFTTKSQAEWLLFDLTSSPI